MVVQIRAQLLGIAGRKMEPAMGGKQLMKVP